ncbi:MAG: AAA family ATPase [Bacteroidales bacterium]|nr:AAA family ATPase [Bacteroidales bacterium]
MEKYKLLPYGISNYAQIKREGLFMVDKTKYLELMEKAGNFLLLIRPRRFGKSLFLSMMESYYDIESKDSFDHLFGDTYAGSHPTPEHNEYQVLRLDFSKPGGTKDTLEENVNGYLDLLYGDFVTRYAKYYPDNYVEEYKQQKSTSDRVNYVHQKFETYNIKSYLIIDEYDNFTNNVLNQHGEAVYHAMTHAEGFYRDLFKKFKGSFTRILMMGVSPVTMDDVTSGYNIATALTLEKQFNEMLGFSEEEVRNIIRYYNEAGAFSLDEDETLKAMRPWYDGYCFSEYANVEGHHVFNTDMVLYYLKSFLLNGEGPDDMIDPNTKTDYAKLDRVVRLDKTEGDRKGVLLEIAQNGYTYGRVKRSFPANQLTDPNMFKSLLFYYGMVTIQGMRGAQCILGMPNNNVREQYFNYLLVEYNKIHTIDLSRLTESFDDAALDGKWQPMMEHICRQYHDTTSVRSLIEGERNLQGFMNALLTLNPYYITCPEVELNHGYCDFFLMPDLSRYPDIRHSYIIELKYLPMTATDAEAEKQWNEAEEQIRGYAKGKVVQQMTQNTELHLVIAQIKGYDLLKLGKVE